MTLKETSKPNSIKTFSIEEEPEVIHVVKLSLLEYYAVITDDAFGTGKCDMYLTAEQVEQKYKISEKDLPK